MGDTIYSNMMVFGAAWQRGLIPLAMRDPGGDRAERRGGGAQPARLRDRPLGGAEPREAARSRAQGGGAAEDAGGEDRLPRRSSDGLPGRALARRYRKLVDRIEIRGCARRWPRAITSCWPTRTNTRSRGCLLKPRKGAGRVRGRFQDDLSPRPADAWPAPGPDGRPKKRAFGPWIAKGSAAAGADEAAARHAFDPFGRTAERRMERALIRRAGSGRGRAGRCRSRFPAGPRAGRARRRASRGRKLDHTVAHRPDMGREHRGGGRFSGGICCAQVGGRRSRTRGRGAAAAASSGVRFTEIRFRTSRCSGRDTCRAKAR
jgi:hypothetical protein